MHPNLQVHNWFIWFNWFTATTWKRFRSTSIGITVNPVRVRRIEEFGSVDTIGQRLLDTGEPCMYVLRAYWNSMSAPLPPKDKGSSVGLPVYSLVWLVRVCTCKHTCALVCLPEQVPARHTLVRSTLARYVSCGFASTNAGFFSWTFLFHPVFCASSTHAH